MARASSLYPTMIVRVAFVKKYQKVVKAKVKVLQSPRHEDKFAGLEIVAFANEPELYSQLANLDKGTELIVTGKREISTFKNKTIEQIILQKITPLSEASKEVVEDLVSSF